MVKAALQIQWCSGMGFKMAFKAEDASRISCVDLDLEETERDMVEKIIEWVEMMVGKLIEEIKGKKRVRDGWMVREIRDGWRSV
ncbi:hypothetical protein Ddye_002170 [Dipteronia dyeriana]|uniref:Uncharacterized protein n=1 Tax=Dipteronia dyeriana TaxID=168575 RepID=A0AAE0CU76_9ROSI|nr:hypothetical protein Ddye_002170 [Dipteronia dyeriana]